MSEYEEIADWVVLIVDDEPDNVDVVRKVLTFYGAEVHTARDGVEGMRLLNSITPTFVLADLSMPNMDGWTLLKTIRATPGLENLIVIALTAHAMADDEKKALSAGFDTYIPKPLRVEDFLKRVKECLHQCLSK